MFFLPHRALCQVVYFDSMHLSTDTRTHCYLGLSSVIAAWTGWITLKGNQGTVFLIQPKAELEVSKSHQD